MHIKSIVSILVLTTSLSAQLGISSVNGTSPPPYIEVASSSTLIPKNGMTFESWITYDGVLGNGWRYPTVARMNQAGGQEAYYMRIDAHNQKLNRLTFKAVTTTGTLNASWNFSAGALKNWTHVAGTYDGLTARLIVNGKQVAAQSSFARGTLKDGASGKGVLRIGCGATVSNAPTIEVWQGEIDEVRLWPFARTANEIAATMKNRLSSVPGDVSTWNLDFKPVDSSGSNGGKDVGKPTYSKNTLSLVTATGSAVSFGTSTAGCVGKPVAGIASLPKIDNKLFAVTCTRAPVGQGGVFWGGLGKLTTAVKVLNTDVWVDTSSVGLLFTLKADGQGYGRLPLPIPNLPILAGLPIHGQFLWEDLGCTKPHSTSAGLTVTLVK